MCVIRAPRAKHLIIRQKSSPPFKKQNNYFPTKFRYLSLWMIKENFHQKVFSSTTTTTTFRLPTCFLCTYPFDWVFSQSCKLCSVTLHSSTQYYQQDMYNIGFVLTILFLYLCRSVVFDMRPKFVPSINSRIHCWVIHPDVFGTSTPSVMSTILTAIGTVSRLSFTITKAVEG